MALTVPSTQQEWLELSKRLGTQSAADYPGTTPTDFEEFKKAAMGRSGPLWIGQMLMPALVIFMIVMQYGVRVVEWGALGWLAALAIGIGGGAFISTRIVKSSREKAVLFGKQYGVFV